MSDETDQEIERFPVEKRQIRYEEPPALIFFDVDEDQDEAEFIRVDDLFAAEAPAAEKLTGRLSFTLVPQKSGELIGSSLSREIHRTLILSGIRLERPLEKVRVRPAFAQWQIELKEGDEPEQIAREFRSDLENRIRRLKKIPADERYWSGNCFVSPIDREITDEAIIRAAAFFQEKA